MRKKQKDERQKYNNTTTTKSSKFKRQAPNKSLILLCQGSSACLLVVFLCLSNLPGKSVRAGYGIWSIVCLLVFLCSVFFVIVFFSVFAQFPRKNCASRISGYGPPFFLGSFPVQWAFVVSVFFSVFVKFARKKVCLQDMGYGPPSCPPRAHPPRIADSCKKWQSWQICRRTGRITPELQNAIEKKVFSIS